MSPLTDENHIRSGLGPCSPFIEARALDKRYPGVHALDNLDFAVSPGEIVALLGKNGAGKSTLIKILAGVVHPDAGTIVVDGVPVRLHSAHDSARLRLAFVHQELADVPNLSVAENVLLGLGYPKRAGVVLDERRLVREASAVLERLGARIDPRAQLKSLRTPQRRLVMIARGFAADARLLVLDEPTTSMTSTEIDHLHEVVRTLRDHGVSVVYVTHRLDEVAAVTDRVFVMRDGRHAFSGPTRELTKAELISHITGTVGASRRPGRPVAGPRGSRRELLKVRDLAARSVVSGVSFELYEGEILGIAGLVGSGRTELVRLIYGADPVAAGEIHVGGKRVRMRSVRDAIRVGIALLPEDRRHQGSIQRLSVRQNITLPSLRKFRRSRGLGVPSLRLERAAARAQIERLQIKVASEESSIEILSGGNQQKVVLAKWLETDANVFIFDEPTQGIDVDGKADVYRLMLDLCSAGKSVIFISSEFSELVATCERVIVFREGRSVGELHNDEINENNILELCYTT